VTRWQYRVVDLGFSTEEKRQTHLNFLGEQGWELVAIVRSLAYLKRTSPESSDTERK
jgi:hypothetical protein